MRGYGGGNSATSTASPLTTMPATAALHAAAVRRACAASSESNAPSSTCTLGCGSAVPPSTIISADAALQLARQGRIGEAAAGR